MHLNIRIGSIEQNQLREILAHVKSLIRSAVEVTERVVSEPLTVYSPDCQLIMLVRIRRSSNGLLGDILYSMETAPFHTHKEIVIKYSTSDH